MKKETLIRKIAEQRKEAAQAKYSRDKSLFDSCEWNYYNRLWNRALDKIDNYELRLELGHYK